MSDIEFEDQKSRPGSNTKAVGDSNWTAGDFFDRGGTEAVASYKLITDQCPHIGIAAILRGLFGAGLLIPGTSDIKEQGTPDLLEGQRQRPA